MDYNERGNRSYIHKTAYFHTGYSLQTCGHLVSGERPLCTRQKCPTPPFLRLCPLHVRMKISAMNASSGHKPPAYYAFGLRQQNIQRRANPEDAVRSNKKTILPSLRMPIFMHFLRRQYWHWFLWCWSMGQFLLPRHEYDRFLRTLLLKNDLQPGRKKR